MTSPTQASTTLSARLRKYELAGMIPFILCHLVIFGAFFSGVTAGAVALGIALFFIRIWAVTAGYHRYFSHRTYKTSRVFQFILAFIAQSSAQKGALWWAAHHRDHHKYSDTENDVHSPIQRGFWYAHVGWLFDHTSETDYSRVKDLAKYPELVWLNEHFLVPPVLLAIGTSLWMGWSGLLIGFFLSTVVTWHATFLVNSLTHVFGKRRFESSDESRNSLLIALVTLGEGWHNNHHYYQSCTRQGFYWWEIDVTYYVLRVLAFFRIVWDIREPPARVLAEGRALDAARRRGEQVSTVPVVSAELDDELDVVPVPAHFVS